MTVLVDQGARCHLLALVVGHPHLALRHPAGGKVEDEMSGGIGPLPPPRHRYADAAGVGAKAAVGTAPGCYHRPRDDADKVHGHQAAGHRHFREVADAPQMVGLRQCHDAAAMGQRPVNRQAHGLLADHLTIAALSVQGQHAADVHGDAGRCIGFEAALEHRINIARQHAHAVRIVAAQVGHHEVGGNRLRLCCRAASCHQNIGRNSLQFKR